METIFEELTEKEEPTIAENKGKVLYFYPTEHQYFVDNVQYKSMSSIIHKNFPEFDEEFHSEKYAEKHGLTKEEVLKTWHDKKDSACEFGTLIHLWGEALLKKYCLNDNEMYDELMEDKDLLTEKEKKYINSVNYYVKNVFTKRFELIECEKMVFSPKYKIAGTMDILARNKKTNEVVILDWKTNEKMQKENDFGQKGLGVLCDLDDCNFSHYSVQLNGYQKILKEEYSESLKKIINSNNLKFKRILLWVTEKTVYNYNVGVVPEIDMIF